MEPRERTRGATAAGALPFRIRHSSAPSPRRAPDIPATLTLRDETATGDVLRERTLDFLDETVTVRELIVRRVQEEVREYNRAAARDAVFTGLVRPSDAEAALNGGRPRVKRELSWER